MLAGGQEMLGQLPRRQQFYQFHNQFLYVRWVNPDSGVGMLHSLVVHKPFCTEGCFSCPRDTRTSCAGLDMFMACMPQGQEVAQDWLCFPLSLLPQDVESEQGWAALRTRGLDALQRHHPELSLEPIAAL